VTAAVHNSLQIRRGLRAYPSSVMSIAGQGKRIALVTDESEFQLLLAALGATADEIHANLRAEGVRARPASTSFDNPIVRYLYRHIDIGGRLDIPLGSIVLTVAREGT